ncbi:ubiquinone biosynthesis protein COQ9 [Viridothelium virens]|uniref:Ubiquinone biosynthesis protein n=1 Tax=Viridothelium virens TaxID=1048519 RepID=A0A6A6GUA3_VIRVR|nr:ubiquinone biosynthesis protein COQ9 [Viridothelium virens]
MATRAPNLSSHLLYRSILSKPPTAAGFPKILHQHHLSSPYYSSAFPTEPPYPPTESEILSAALSRVLDHGFTSRALSLGATDAGYLEVSANLFPRREFEIVLYHLVRERMRLGERVQFAEEGGGRTVGARRLGVGEKIQSLVMGRLRANVEVGVQGRWGEAIALMAVPSNVPPSLQELARLADEIWYLSGDTSVDGSWYTKRASLASVYAASEVFMTQDQSTDYKDTEQFVEDRLRDVQTVGSWIGNTVEWVGYTGWAGVNLLRSKGFRI